MHTKISKKIVISVPSSNVFYSKVLSSEMKVNSYSESEKLFSLTNFFASGEQRGVVHVVLHVVSRRVTQQQLARSPVPVPRRHVQCCSLLC